MRALLVRHAIAADRTVFPGPDRDRPLTRDGAKRFRIGAQALARLVPDLGVIFTSPFVRARQTAESLAHAYPAEPTLAEASELAPGGDPGGILELLRGQRRIPAVALVGHEPDLSLLEGYLLSGRARPLAEFRKGGAALIEFSARVAAGGGLLLWHLTAGQVRRMGS